MLDGNIKGTPSASLRLRNNADNYDMVFIPADEADAARCAGLTAMTVKSLSDFRGLIQYDLQGLTSNRRGCPNRGSPIRSA